MHIVLMYVCFLTYLAIKPLFQGQKIPRASKLSLEFYCISRTHTKYYNLSQLALARQQKIKMTNQYSKSNYSAAKYIES